MTAKLSPRLAAIVDALPLRPGIRVLEIGCGPGAAARAIAHRIGDGHIVAIDRSAKAVQQAIASSAPEIAAGRMSVRRVAVEDFELEPGEPPFDLAFAVRVGALDGRHPELERQARDRIARALVPDGKFFTDGGNPLRQVHLQWPASKAAAECQLTLRIEVSSNGISKMDTMSMIDRLAALPGLAAIPREQLRWLVDHGEVHRADDGAVFRAADGDLIGLFLLISGRFSVRVDQGGVERDVREVTPGRVTGYLPYSRMTTARGYVVADGPVEFLSIRLEDLQEMTRQCYEFTAVCVHEMVDRVRVFKADDKRQEKMAALGRLSAGLAHELNNPASAAARAARELDIAHTEMVAASRDLGAAGLAGESLRALQALESAVRERAGEPLSPMDLTELEDRLIEWLDDREVDTEIAYPLSERGLTVADLEAVAPAFGAGELGPVLRYLAADCTVRGLTADISSAAERIHSLVAAVKKHTHMDRAPAVEPIRLEQHLADTVTLMSSKASLKGASVELRVEADLPPVEGSVSDLNQVWMHLVDNAIDAVTEAGRIVIDARRNQNNVVVCVVDDGPGIPPERQERVFEPFFTTTDIGEGRGLGLDIVRAVVRSHRGTVDLSSIPGRTEFRVALPAFGGGEHGD